MKLRVLKKRLLPAVILVMSVSSSVSALPSQGAFDNSSTATISTAGNTMSIAGKNVNNILNWHTFSVGSGETVRFMDKNNYLNLVNGFDISRIYGTISGGGTVYLVNPYGVLFGQGATLDNIGSFIASTRDISDINQQTFLTDPNNITSVLYTDKKGSRNKDYFPDDSPYVPTISVAEINLTNVPASATQIVLDGPGGVVLKNTVILDKVSQVSTQVGSGEIGIGSSSGDVVLTDQQKQKISLFVGQSRFPFDFNPNILKSYKLITNASELQSMSNGNYLLGNNIDVSSISNFNPIEYKGTFDGLGYDISNLRIDRTSSADGSAGLFSVAQGTIRNLNLKEVDIAGGYSYGGISAYEPPNRTYDAVGAVAAKFNGSMSNVHVTSSIEKNDGVGVVNGYDAAHITGYGAVRGYDRVGGLVGQLGHDDMGVYDKKSEIRNSSNGATVVLNGVNYVGGIVGRGGSGNLFNVYNTGDINIGSPYKVRQTTYYPEGIGGIAGESGGRILSAYNKGRVFGGRYAAGIVGFPSGEIGDAYNLGDIIVNDYAYDYVGNIIGAKGTVSVDGGWGMMNLPEELEYYTSKESGRKLPSYYVKGKLKTLGDDVIEGVDFGIGVTDAEMKNLLNHGQYNSIVIPTNNDHINTDGSENVIENSNGGIPTSNDSNSDNSSKTNESTVNNNPAGNNNGNNGNTAPINNNTSNTNNINYSSMTTEDWVAYVQEKQDEIKVAQNYEDALASIQSRTYSSAQLALTVHDMFGPVAGEVAGAGGNIMGMVSDIKGLHDSLNEGDSLGALYHSTGYLTNGAGLATVIGAAVIAAPEIAVAGAAIAIVGAVTQGIIKTSKYYVDNNKNLNWFDWRKENWGNLGEGLVVFSTSAFDSLFNIFSATVGEDYSEKMVNSVKNKK